MVRDGDVTQSNNRTVLFRPVGTEETVCDHRPTILKEYLASEAPGKLVELRINRSKNLVDVDAKTAGGVNKLLALATLCAI